MDGSDGSPPLSLGEIVRAAELFPKSPIEKEDEKLSVPFTELPGESVKYLGHTDDGVLALSNYRLFLLKTLINPEKSVPLGLIESAQIRDLFSLIISCKDATTVKCSFGTSECCAEWHRRITLSIGVPDKLESLFAFPFYAWTSETINSDSEWTERLRKVGNNDHDFEHEVKRLRFNLNSSWRISEVNKDFKLCPSYPRYILVPNSISDEILQNVASFRSSRRIPAIVWRHKKSGAVIARCSQPEVGWLGWRNPKDEQLLKAITDACEMDKPVARVRNNSNASDLTTASSSSPENNLDLEKTNNFSEEPKKILIVDARSYTSAVTNRARGGGCECAEYYPTSEIQFMNLGNIHAIRKSFHALRQLCASPPDIPNWLGLLERTVWLQHMSGLLAASMVVCHAIERQGRPILVHCSDGWDRTPQIVATAQLCLDPFYRTVEGFRILVEREWLNFGHKFADRCGHGPGSDENNERCPVFLQWLDCVHQIHRQFPCSFEFSMGYLIKLAQHSNSCLFGTFLCNTVKDRNENTVQERTFSVWPFLSGSIYKNPLYVPNREKVLWPAHNVRDLFLWSEVYLGNLGNQNSLDGSPRNAEHMNPMTKTRSYGDLATLGEIQGGLTRRSSDPSMTIDSHILNPLSSDDNSIDSSSDRAISPGLLNLMTDTTKKLQNLTHDLCQSDDEFDISNLHQQHHMNGGEHDIYNDVISIGNESLNTFLHETSMVMQANNVLNVIKTGGEEENYGGEEGDSESNNTHETSKDPIISDNNIIGTYKNGIDKVVIQLPSNLDTIGLSMSCNEIDELNERREIDCVDGVNLDLMLQSVDLNDTSSPIKSQSVTQNTWYGSVETSTDTLVPVLESTKISLTSSITKPIWNMIESVELNNDLNNDCDRNQHNETIYQNGSGAILSLNNGDQFDGGGGGSGNVCRTNENIGHGSGVGISNGLSGSGSSIMNSIMCSGRKSRTISTSSQMDESIFIQPEYAKLDINGGSNHNNYNNNHNTNNRSDHRRRNSINSSHGKNYDFSPNKYYFNGSTSPSMTNSRFSTPGGRSLPLTPPSANAERPPVTISCPDGLAHALSEQNLRLQQLVYEHKLREEALEREVYIMRIELQKKASCQQCAVHNNITQYANDEPEDMNNFINDELDLTAHEALFLKKTSTINQISPYFMTNCEFSELMLNGYHGSRATSSSMMINYNLVGSNDSNLENASVCSWEALDDGQTTNVNAQNDLWVPDHAVNRCTGCHMVFWLGRRKHHCRACGQIFCADCSEYRASLPNKKLYAMVRLCALCYNNQINGTTSTIVNNATISNSQDCNIPVTNECSSSSITTISSSTAALLSTPSLTNTGFSTVPSLSVLATRSTSISSVSSTQTISSLLHPTITVKPSHDIQTCSHQSIETGNHHNHHHCDRNASTYKATTATN